MLERILEYGSSDLEIKLGVIKITFIFLCTYFTNFKIANKKVKFDINSNFNMFMITIIAIACAIIRYKVNNLVSIICIILLITLIFDSSNIRQSILITITSYCINYTISLISVILNFIINVNVKLNENIVNLIIILGLHIIILESFFHIKKFKYGICALQNNAQNENIDILILNIVSLILFLSVVLVNTNLLLIKSLSIGLIVLSIIMFITIQKSLQLYYKQKLLIKELEETKEELQNKNKEIEELEAENLSFSKKSHSLVHKQKSLEYKLQQLIDKSKISQEETIEAKKQIEEISKELYKEKTPIKLDKTDIAEIDDMLTYMQSECIKNKIEFELQLKGNIHYMTNNLISKEDLEILLADHIKDAIIAINHTDNINRSILVRLGIIDEIYSLYIYDSGIEFDKEVLENLGKKPCTTHADEGGTGMGFMNTFDTLRKYQASLIIEEYNKPSKENYTKAIIIKFDKKNEFKIESYRTKEKTLELSTKNVIIVDNIK